MPVQQLKAAPASRVRPPALQVLIVTLAVAVLAPLALFGYSAWSLDRSLQRGAERRIEVELNVLNQHTLRVLQAAELAIRAMRLLTLGMTSEQIRAHEAALHAELLDLGHGMPAIQSLWLIGRDGDALATDRVSPLPPLNAADRDFYRALQAGDVGTFIGQVYAPKLPGPPFFSVARRRVGPDGAFDGVIDVSLLPSDFEHVYSRLDPRHAEEYETIRWDGDILARFPSLGRPDLALNPALSPLMHEISVRPEGGAYIARSSLDGIERVYGYSAVPGYRLYSVVGITTEALRAAWWTSITRELMVGVPATLLLIITLLIAIQRTQRLYAETEGRRAAEAALSRTQRLEAIGQLTGGVAHDFNNLLTVILASTESLRPAVADPNDRRSLDLIEGAVQRGVALIRQLLTFASRQALAFEVIDLARHIAGMEEMLRRSLRGDILLDIDTPKVPTPVKADPGELELALLNVAINARDAMPSGGRLLVRVRSVILDGGPTTEGLAGSFAAVSLTDTGGGIPAAALPRVFEPFFTTKEVGKGTGLGLSQVYGFARQSGGTVTIDSTLGRGTTVTIYLPASTGTAAEPGFVRSPARASGRGRRILLVEDNAEVSDVVRGLLVNLGFVVQSAASGRAALDRLEAGQRFDLVFSDIVMPGELNGIDLMREVRHRYPAQPVLLTSGYSAMAEQALREGCPFLPKPYEIERVRAAVEQAMRRDDAQDIVWAGAGAVTQAGSLGRDG